MPDAVHASILPSGLRLALRCETCGANSSGDAAGWRTYRVDVVEYGDRARVVVFYCPACVQDLLWQSTEPALARAEVQADSAQL